MKLGLPKGKANKWTGVAKLAPRQVLKTLWNRLVPNGFRNMEGAQSRICPY